MWFRDYDDAEIKGVLGRVRDKVLPGVKWEGREGWYYESLVHGLVDTLSKHVLTVTTFVRIIRESWNSWWDDGRGTEEGWEGKKVREEARRKGREVLREVGRREGGGGGGERRNPQQEGGWVGGEVPRCLMGVVVAAWICSRLKGKEDGGVFTGMGKGRRKRGRKGAEEEEGRIAARERGIPTERILR